MFSQQVLCLPRTTKLFSLEQYQEEIGKDYTRLHLYLSRTEDYNNTLEDCENRVRMKAPLILHQSMPKSKMKQFLHVLKKESKRRTAGKRMKKSA